MNPEAPEQRPPTLLRDILSSALDISDSGEREAYLDAVCGENLERRELVESLLAAHPDSAGFLDLSVLGDDTDPLGEGPGSSMGPYELVERLGEGGFGVVYLAEQWQPVRRQVALKIIKPGMDSKEVIARFEVERQALAMMDHPNIAKVFDAGATETGRPYFVMELVKGIPVTRFCNERQLEIGQRIGLFLEVCSAVQHAHQKGIIHRDLKPSNILVSEGGDRPLPKVIDFGIAKATPQPLTDKTLFTRFAQFVGTPIYMSPEQAVLNDLDVDTRADIYGLGVLLYELLTGMPPFDEESLLRAGYDEMRRIIREEEPPKPSSRLGTMTAAERSSVAGDHHADPERLGKLLRGDLDWIVMKAMEKDRTRRYETANALALDIRRHLNHEPVRARRPTVAYQFGKWARRHKIAFAVAGVVATAVIAVAVVSIYSAGKLKESEQELKNGLARQYLLRGQALCKDGDVTNGLHWMVRAIEEAPRDRVALRRDIENNLIAWSRQWVAPELALRSHTNVVAAAFSPDGRHLITGSTGGRLTLWSLPSGEQVWETRHDESIFFVAFTSEGKRIVTTGSDEDDEVRLWSAETGDPVGQPMDRSELKPVLSPDGTMVLAGGGEDAVRVYSAVTGEPLTPPLQHEAPVSTVAFTPDSKRAFTACSDGTARIWDARTGESIGPVFALGGYAHVVAFHPVEPIVAIAENPGHARIFSLETGQELVTGMRHQGRILGMAFRPGDGSHLLTSSVDHTARLWSTETGEPAGKTMRHDSWQGRASFSPDGKLVLTEGGDATVRVWSAETGEPVGLPLRFPDHWQLEASFSPRGDRILAYSAHSGSSMALIWDARSIGEQAKRTISLPTHHFSHSAQFSPDGKMVVSGSRAHRRNVRLWDAATGERREAIYDEAVWMLRFSPDGRRLLVGGADGRAHLMRFPSGESFDFDLTHDSGVRGVAFSVDGTLMATASYDGTARIWSAEDGLPKSDHLEHPNSLTDVVFSPDGRDLVTACADGVARLWSVETGEPEPIEFDHGARLSAVDLSPDGTLIATGGADRVVKLWDVASGTLTDTVFAHEGFVEDVTFNADGRWLLSASRDSTVRLWSVQTGLQIGPSLMPKHAAPVECSFSPDQQRALIAAIARNTRIVELPLRFLNQEPHPNPRLWIEVLTRMEMDQHGTLSWIEPGVWSEKREELKRLQE